MTADAGAPAVFASYDPYPASTDRDKYRFTYSNQILFVHRSEAISQTSKLRFGRWNNGTKSLR